MLRSFCSVMSLIGNFANLVKYYETIKHRIEVNDTNEVELILPKGYLTKRFQRTKAY